MDPDNDPGQRIALAWRAMRRGSSTAQLRSLLASPDGHRLEQAQLDALEVLGGDPHGWRMTEFADALHVDPSTATRTVDRLHRMGLAHRSVDTEDGRVVRVELSDAGRRTLTRIRARRADWMDRLLEPFSAPEREQLASLLERFVSSIDQLAREVGGERIGAERKPAPRKG